MDKHVRAVIRKIETRSEAGLKKYGTTLERDDLTELDWLIHAQEEAMDLALYIQTLISKWEDQKLTTSSYKCRCQSGTHCSKELDARN